MKAQFKDMPPLGPGEAPWADHEVQVHAVFNGAEETPPEGLESRILEALDAQLIQPVTNHRAPWFAAAVAGSVVIAALWMASGEAMQEPAATVPVEVSITQGVEPVQQPSLKQALEVSSSNEEVVEQQSSEGVYETSQAASGKEEEVTDRKNLEVMTGLESSAIPAKLDVNRTPIQSSKTRRDTVRLKGTLKLKQ